MTEELRVLIVEDEDPLRKLFHKRLVRKGAHVDSYASAEDAAKTLADTEFDVALIDIKLPGRDGISLLQEIKAGNGNTEAIVITGHGTIDSAIAAMKLGAYDYLTKPCKLAELEALIDKAYEKKKLHESNSNLKEELRLKNDYGEIIGKSARMRDTLRIVKKVAKSNSTILIEGETGTGKELIANAIHKKSFRRDESFIVVQCSALPDSLMESELFGYEKGAFTGASKMKRGLVELANHGTLFIDEIGEVSLALQVKLLRFIETGRFRRLGAERERAIDVRIISATNRNLLHEVKQGRFREDLYYRLKVLNLLLPPLRERTEDIPLLANYFLKKKGPGKILTKAAIRELLQYEWPGNVRELANVVEMSAILSGRKQINCDELPIHTKASQEGVKTLADIEKEHIRCVLESCLGNKTKAAKSLGISLRNLYRKIERYEIQTGDHRSS